MSIKNRFDPIIKKNNKFDPIYSIGGQTAPQVTTNKLPSYSTSTGNSEYSIGGVQSPVIEKQLYNAQKNSVFEIVDPDEKKFTNIVPDLPESTISQAKKTTTEEPSIWNKIARTVLPKAAEEYFELSQPELTAKDRVIKAEDAKQSYWRGQRKEENISQVTAPTEQYTSPTNFGQKLLEVGKYGGYIKNTWSGFIKPALGTVAEQYGIQTDNPKLRAWGEQFADKMLERESRKASGQSMADVPSALEGGLIDPRYYSKTMTQAIAFMATILGSSAVVTGATGNPFAGMATGFAVGGALESTSAYKSMIDKGINPADANTAAQIYGTIASVIENSTGLKPALGTKKLMQDFSITAATDTTFKKFLKNWAGETLEEGSQQLVENLVTKFVDNNQEVFEGVAESMIGGLVGALPLTGGASIVQNKIEKNYKKNQPAPEESPANTVPFANPTITTPPLPPPPPDGPSGQTQIVDQDIAGKDGGPLVISHFTNIDNIDSILTEGFDTSRAPIHGIRGFEGGEATEKFGNDILYFTTDTGRWNSALVFVGEGNGNISQQAYDYENQKWKTEENAYKKIDLVPIESTIKDEAKILTIDSIATVKKIFAAEGKQFYRNQVVEDLIEISKKRGYDILNIKKGEEGAWEEADADPTKTGYDRLTGNSGNDDYFILNKDILNIKGSKQKTTETIEQPTTKPLFSETEARGLYADTLEDALFMYNSNPERISAKSESIQTNEFEEFFTEEELLKASGQTSTSKPLFAGTETKKVYEPEVIDGPGHSKFNNFIDELARNNTIFKEEVPILKAIFGSTNDNLLNTINYYDNPHLRTTLGQFKIGRRPISKELAIETNSLEMMKRLAEKKLGSATPSQTFLHEYGHAGWWLVLNEEERTTVTVLFNSKTKEEQRAFFADHNTNYEYYAENEREFWAQSFSDYVMENKVSDKQMEPLLKRIAKRFFNGLKSLIARKNTATVDALRPLFEKILVGDKTTPLTEFANMEHPSFKQDLQNLFQRLEAAEQTTTPKPLFTGTQPTTKTVTAGKMFPDGMPMPEVKPLFTGKKSTEISGALNPEEESLFASAPESYFIANYEPYINSPAAPTLQKQILDAKKKYEEEQTNEKPPSPVEFPTQVLSIRNSVSNSPILRNIDDYKDIASIKIQFRDIYRNTEEVFGKDFDYADRILLAPLDKSKGDLIDFYNKEVGDLKNVVRFGKKSKESKYIQRYGEKKTTKEELILIFGEKKADEIIRADSFFRMKYDELLSKLNKVEQQIYPQAPYKWTPKKENYYRHFAEASNSFSYLQSLLQNPLKINPMLVGLTETTKPNSKWASFKQRRNTEKTKEDAVGGYIDYVKSVGYAINIDPHIGRVREFSNMLKRGTKVNKNLNNYIKNLENLANELSGKTPELDRVIAEHVPFGKSGLSAMNFLNNRVKANTILYNAKSAMAQILNLPQGLATAGPINSAIGAARSIAEILIDGPMDQSDFIKERFFRGFNKFDKGILQDTKKFGVWMVGALDEVATKIIWNGQYQKGKNLGVKDPIRYADSATRKLVAGRGIAEKPTVQNSQTFQLLAPFQYEMTNVWWVMEDIAKSGDRLDKKIGQMLMLWLYSYLTNEFFEAKFGARPLFDPYEVIIDGIQEIQADPSGLGYVKAGGRAVGEVVSNLPGGQFIGSAYDKYGPTIFGVKAPTRKELFGSGDPTRYGEGLLSTKALNDPLFKVLPAYGGVQIKKTLQGLAEVSEGKSVTEAGNVRYKIDQTFRNYMRAILYGKYALPEAIEYYKQFDKPVDKTSSSSRNKFDPIY